MTSAYTPSEWSMPAADVDDVGVREVGEHRADDADHRGHVAQPTRNRGDDRDAAADQRRDEPASRPASRRTVVTADSAGASGRRPSRTALNLPLPLADASGRTSSSPSGRRRRPAARRRAGSMPGPAEVGRDQRPERDQQEDDETRCARKTKTRGIAAPPRGTRRRSRLDVPSCLPTIRASTTPPNRQATRRLQDALAHRPGDRGGRREVASVMPHAPTARRGCRSAGTQDEDQDDEADDVVPLRADERAARDQDLGLAEQQAADHGAADVADAAEHRGGERLDARA